MDDKNSKMKLWQKGILQFAPEEGIENEVASDLCDKISKINLFFPETKEIRIFINTVGGDWGSTFQIVSAIESSTIPVVTVSNGYCMSGGFIILMTGDKRLVSKNCMLMSHGVRSDGPHYAGRSEINSYVKEFNVMADIIVAHYGLYLKNGKKKDIKKLTGGDEVYMTPAEAVKYGAADKVVEDIYHESPLFP